jgi:hypothetical protein
MRLDYILESINGLDENGRPKTILEVTYTNLDENNKNIVKQDGVVANDAQVYITEAEGKFEANILFNESDSPVLEEMEKYLNEFKNDSEHSIFSLNIFPIENKMHQVTQLLQPYAWTFISPGFRREPNGIYFKFGYESMVVRDSGLDLDEMELQANREAEEEYEAEVKLQRREALKKAYEDEMKKKYLKL